MIRVVRSSVALAAVCLVAAAASAAGQEPLPSAEQVIARYHQAIGGADAWAAIRSVHSVGEITVPLAGMTGVVESWQARPNRSRMHATLGGLGTIRTGFDGTRAWSINPVEGPRIHDGDELLQAADDANFDSVLRRAPAVASLESVERTTMAGHECISVRVSWASGRTTTDCFSTETGLLVSSTRRQVTSADEMDAIVLYDDYREVDGLRMPTRITTRLGPLEQIVTLTDIRVDDVDDSTFTPPPEIQALGGN